MLALTEGETPVANVVSDVYDTIRDEVHSGDLFTTVSKSENRFHNKVRWQGAALKDIGFIHSTKRGVWSLTDSGKATMEKLGLL
jgi:restriction endonuclease Mrr